ncbi:MAG TPA: IclR family transcriptional regulator [Bryobacteraceae bacterium]|nr:IclR family transcriptional regulator [Bryobacteraceae bacterium]
MPASAITKKIPRETPSIQSLDRGLTILETVAKSPGPVSLDDLAAVLEIDRSSVFRLANTLKRRGFLAYPSNRKDYILGPSIWSLSREYSWGSTLADISHEHLKRLANSLSETAHLAVREGKQALFINHATINQVLSVSGQTGELVPLYCTAHGKALLCDYSKADLEKLFGLGPLRAHTSRTVTSISKLASLCARYKTDGFASDDAEFLEGVRCLAAPIRDLEGVIVGSIGISAPLSRFPEERHSLIVKEVCKTAREIGKLLVPEGQ